MHLVNLMEGLIIRLADSYLRDKNIPADSNMRMDIIVYALNRVTPQYVTSARGILHSIAKNEAMQINADILSVIAEACEVVSRRSEDILFEQRPAIAEDGHYLVYPGILGNIFCADQFVKADSALVYAFNNGTLLEGYGASFPNPAVVSEHIPGKFMFCFAPKKMASDEVSEVTLDIVVTVTTPSYQQHKTSFVFKVQPRYYKVGDIPSFDIEEIEDIFLSGGSDSRTELEIKN